MRTYAVWQTETYNYFFIYRSSFFLSTSKLSLHSHCLIEWMQVTPNMNISYIRHEINLMCEHAWCEFTRVKKAWSHLPKLTFHIYYPSFHWKKEWRHIWYTSHSITVSHNNDFHTEACNGKCRKCMFQVSFLVRVWMYVEWGIKSPLLAGKVRAKRLITDSIMDTWPIKRQWGKQSNIT